MQRRFIFIYLMVLTLVTSCTVTVRTADSVSIKNSVHNYPVIGDLDIGKKVTETKEWNNTPLNKTSLETGKGNLISETVCKYDGDVLVEPQFIIESTGYPFFRHHKVTVMGYIGNYKGFRNATESDLKALETANKLPQGEVVRYNDNTGLKIFRK